MPPIFELRLDNKPVLVLCKAVAGYPGRDGGIEFRRRARYKLRLLGVGSRLRRATEGALWGLFGVSLMPDQKARLLERTAREQRGWAGSRRKVIWLVGD